MLTIMHEAEPRGHLLINGRPLEARQLAALSGVSFDETVALLSDLELAGVFSRKKNGVIFSRRMEKDENKTRKLRENGKKGGNPSLCNKKENSALDNQPDKPQKPEARSQKEANASSEKRASAQFALEFATNFWPIYPNKVGKPKALEAFLKARKAASLEAIIDGLNRYIAGKPADRSWLNPTTFLNQERWADEPATTHGAGNVKHHSNPNQRTSQQDDIASGVADFYAAQRLRQSHGASSYADRPQRSADENSGCVSFGEVTLDRGTDGTYGDDPLRASGYGYRGH